MISTKDIIERVKLINNSFYDDLIAILECKDSDLKDINFIKEIYCKNWEAHEIRQLASLLENEDDANIIKTLEGVPNNICYISFALPNLMINDKIKIHENVYFQNNKFSGILTGESNCACLQVTLLKGQLAINPYSAFFKKSKYIYSVVISYLIYEEFLSLTPLSISNTVMNYPSFIENSIFPGKRLNFEYNKAEAEYLNRLTMGNNFKEVGYDFDELKNLINFLFYDTKKISSRLVSAFHYLYESTIHSYRPSEIETAVIMLTCGIEALYKKNNDEKKENFCGYFSLFVGINEAEREQILEKSKELYKIRNGIVHGDLEASKNRKVHFLVISVETYLYRGIIKSLRQEL